MMADPAGQTAQAVALLPAWLHRLQYYVLALLFVAAAALVRGVIGDVLSPVPFLVFYLAWVGAAAFGGLGPGLLATVASWWCVDLFFAPAAWHVGFRDAASVGRFMVLLAGGLAVSVVGEVMRRSRIHGRRQGRELADADAALRASGEKYRLLVENSKDITWTADLQGKLTFISSNLEKVTGYRADELIGKMLWDFLAPESRDLVKETLRRRVRGEDLPPYELLFVGKDGRRMPFEVLTASIVDDGGNIVGVQGVSRDITERKRAEERLRRGEQDLNRAQAVAQTGSWRLDVRRNELLWSQETYRMFGIPKGTPMTYETFLAAVHPADQQYVDRQWTAALRGEPYDIEHRIVVDGQLKWVRERAELEFDEEGTLLGGFGTVQDITERKQAEQNLSESRNKYQALIETTADFIWEMDTSGKYTYCSPQMKGLWGYEPKDMIGKTPFDVMPPEDRKQARASFMARAKSPKPFTGLEAPSYDSRGRLIAVEISGVPFFDADGRWLGYRGISRDVTQRKRAEEALRSSQSMLQSVMENVPQGIFWKDRHSTYLGGNKVFVKAVGLESARDIIGKTDYDLPWSPEQTASFREYDRRIMENDAPEYHIIEPMREASGKLAWVETNKVPLHDAQGHVIGILGTYEDITERKQAEEALRQSEEKHKRLIETTDTGYVIIDDQGRVIDANQEYARLTGRGCVEDVVGHSVLEWTSPGDVERNAAAVRECAERGFVRNLEVDYLTPTGQLIPVEINATVLRAGGSIQILSLTRDITERKRAEEALREWNATLESKVAQRTAELEHRARQLQKLTLELSEAEERERERVAQILHDDLQQVLAAAKFHLSFLHGGTRSPEQAQEIVGHVKEMLKDAIEKSRNLSHELHPGVLREGDLVETFDWLAERVQAQYGLAVRVEAFGAVETRSEAVKVLVYRAAQEMLFNVVKHAQVREARIRVRRRGRYLCLSVSDRGRGFDPQEIRKTAGFGLLSIRERVASLGGRTKIRSAAGQGTTFHIVVPDAGPSGGMEADRQGTAPAQ